MFNKNENNCECNKNEELEEDFNECECEDEHQGCGCGHEHNRDDMIQITLEDDTVVNCFVIGTFEYEDEEYIALLAEDNGEVLLYKYHVMEDDEITLSNIEDDEEYDKISQIFDQLMEHDD